MMKNPFVQTIIVLLATNIYLSCARAEPTIAFINVNVVPMTGEFVVENQTVVIQSGRISQIGDADQMHLPKNTTIIDGKGYFLMPGLADLHMHTSVEWENEEIWPVNPLNLYLANGITTIRDFAPYGSLTYTLQRREKIRSGTRIGPAIYSSGELLYESPLDNPQKIVRQNYAMGFDFLKLYSFLSPEDFHQAMVTAKELGMYTSGHIPFGVGLDLALSEGLDEIAHIEELFFEFIDFDRERYLSPNVWLPFIVETALSQWDIGASSVLADFEKENSLAIARISQRIRTSQVPVCTTMVVDNVIHMKLFQPDDFLERAENVYFERAYLGNFQRGEEKHIVQCRGIEDLCAFKYDVDRILLRALHDAEVTLLLGTDSGTGGMGIVPGYSIHDELRILVENGFSPYEAIATGTVNAALVVGRMTGESDFGTIVVGNRADLILVRGNPLEDVGYIRDPLGVMAAGNWYSKDELAQMISFSQ